jgi:hypothetical protein
MTCEKTALSSPMMISHIISAMSARADRLVVVEDPTRTCRYRYRCEPAWSIALNSEFKIF